MKKFVSFLLVSFVICLLSLSFVACANNSNLSDDNSPDTSTDNNQSDNPVQINKYTHTVKIDSENLFNYYFTFNATNNYQPTYNFETSYGTKSMSTVTITPKLTGFVDYSGYVEFKPKTENENKSDKVLKNRRINVEYWGITTDIYEVNNETGQHDSTISFDDVLYEFYAADILITYHHEGLSGDKSLSYKTINLTKYNYTSYLTINIENRSYYTTSYYESDYYHRYPIYTYHYYQKYTITPSSIKGYYEFNNIKLTFDNGVIIILDALGKATYQSDEYGTERKIPKLSKISGCIDFYPPAIYEYSGVLN